MAEPLGALARLDPVRIELSGHDDPAISAYVERHTGVTLPPEAIRELADRTNGNPFYLTEVVRLLAFGGQFGPDLRAQGRAVLGVVLGSRRGATALRAGARSAGGGRHRPRAERRDVLVGWGRALRRLDRPIEAWSPLATAATDALTRGEPGEAAETLLEITEGAVWGWRLRAEVDVAAIALWRALLEAMGPDFPDPLRARVETALAVEVLYRPTPTSCEPGCWPSVTT